MTDPPTGTGGPKGEREMSTDAYVIVGASLAGAKATETLREQGFDGPITLIGEETERPYERPPLSKDYLLGKADRETIYVHPESWYAEHGVDLRLGARVTGLDTAAHEIRLANSVPARANAGSEGFRGGPGDGGGATILRAGPARAQEAGPARAQGAVRSGAARATC